jgi:hypothetical protein
VPSQSGIYATLFQGLTLLKTLKNLEEEADFCLSGQNCQFCQQPPLLLPVQNRGARKFG